MKIAVITTGDEVIQGVIVDSNAAWISERCTALGHEVAMHACVPDDMRAIGDILRLASERAECVMVTGGLGPTADDITVEAAARAFDANLVRNEGIIEEMRAFFVRVGRPYSPSNDKQAMVFAGSEILPNRVGTAPGLRAPLGGRDFIFLPGVPSELHQIFGDSVEPWLRERSSGARVEKVFRCFGLPEATIDERLKGVDLCGARLSFRVKFPEILLKTVARSGSEAEARRMIDSAAGNIRERLGEVIYGEGDATLAEVVGRMCVERGATLSVAESCTGGLISSMITDVPGASRWFERGAVAYSNRSKEEFLGVPRQTIERHGAVSREVAEAMARGIRSVSGSSVGLAVTGIAGPSGGTAEKPVGTVHIAMAIEGGIEHSHHVFERARIEFRQMVAATALDMARRHMIRAQS
ncbi:MAG: competence/damage-inducible protein A [Proteobacteria bacterium]|nr:competence/damage-inducible protein A [Pseudomonadota bacterium]